jgi:MSHA biogenesis protein MshQ
MGVRRFLVAGWWTALMLGQAAPALAASYDFPSAMPPGCSGSNGSYTCNTGSLSNGDTVTISGTRPATVTVTRNLNLNGARINPGGSASDLRLVVQGTLTPGYGAVVNADVTADEMRDADGQVSFGGTLRATTGPIVLGYKTSVAGAISAGNDGVTLDNEAVAGSSINASKGVTTGYRSRVAGDITAGDDVSIGQEATVGGAVSVSGSRDVIVGYAATVSGNISSANGRVSLGQTAVVGACVQVANAGRTITLDYQARATAVCCGTVGSCSTSCVANNSSYSLPPACTVPATLIAKYDFNEASYAGTTGELKDTAGYGSGPYNGKAQGSPLPTVASTTPARAGSPGTCSYASLPGPLNNGGGFIITGLPVSTTAGAKTSVAFWMYWNGTTGVMPLGWQAYDLWLQNGGFGFNTNSSDVYGIANASLNKVWRHVVAVFTNGSVTSNKIYIDGVLQTLSHRTTSTNPNAGNAVVGSTLRLGGFGASTSYRMGGAIDQVRVYNGELSAANVATLYAETASTCTVPGPHHLEIQHASGTGLTCTPSTLTVKACADAACSTAYTGGVTGTLGATGGSVNWPDGAAFTIASGSSTTTERVQATTTTATVLGVATSTPAATNAATCTFGSPSCTFTAADAGFVFDVAHHVSEVVQTINVSAVRKSDNSAVCVPAFASASKAVTFSCGYTNPTTGTLPLRVGGSALNSSANAAAACDAGGRAVTLAFNASGVASTTVQYADVGQVLLSARYAGAAGSSEAGLVMTGSDSFIAAPDSFTVSGVTAGPIRAASSFAATVSARNSAGNTTPNFGRETGAENANLAWVRIQPSGSGAVNGSFSGSLGAFSAGSASASNLAWTEAGRGDLLARGANPGGYLGTGLFAFGSSAASGARYCAGESGNCVLPGATTATVYYGENSTYTAKTGQTGTVGCNNGVFGDPLPGVVKSCWYAATPATTGSVGDFIPHRFTVAASNACGAFSYAGQPMPATVTAQNAAGNTTVNFNGTATTTPAFAQAVTLADANGLGLGTLSGASIAASAFSAGVASATPSYSFTTKATAPQSLVLRATNGSSGASLISSQGYAEPTLPLRSGRLRLSNAFGKASAALQVPVVAEYWSGSAWLLNSADSCTALAGASVALGNPRSATGAASAATSSAGALAIASGSGTLTLAAPSPAGSTLSLDIALNLGSTSTDQSCNSAHPATTGAAKPWLQAQNGGCAATADRDPAARASFGIFGPETRKTVHVRDLY